MRLIKPLLKLNIRNSLSTMIIITLGMIFINVKGFSSYLNSYAIGAVEGASLQYEIMDTSDYVILIIALILIVFGTKFHKDKEYYRTLPYSKNEIFVNKAAVIYGFIIGALVVDCIAQSFAYINVSEQVTNLIPYSLIIKLYFYKGIEILYTLSSLVFAYCLTTGIFSFLVSTVAVGGAYAVITQIVIPEWLFDGSNHGVIDSIVGFFNKGMNLYDETYIFGLLLNVLLIVIFTYLAYLLYKNMPSGDTNFPFKSFKTLVEICGSFLFSFFGLTLVARFVITSLIVLNGYILTIITLVLTAGVFYLYKSIIKKKYRLENIKNTVKDDILRG